MMKFYLATMEGITGYVYRGVHHKLFPSIDKYFTPFISPNQNRCMGPREKKDVLPENNEGIYLVPQILTNNAEYFASTVRELQEFGYNEVNLNFGCPSGTVVTKKKGAGFLSVPKELDAFLNEIFEKCPDVKISIKTRVGLENTDEFGRILDIYNKYPLEELIVHPRVQKDFYKNLPRMEAYELATNEARAQICYNGDLFEKEKFDTFTTRFPQTDAVMIGRGILTNPALARTLQGGELLKKEELKVFHDEVYHGYIDRLQDAGEKTVLFKMKELWFYMGKLFPDAKKQLKQIKKSEKLSNYEIAVNNLFRECELTLEGITF